MADAVQYDIMTQIQTALQAMTFASQEGNKVRSMASEAIVWEKVPDQFADNQTPGIVITPPKRVSMPLLAGENARDDIQYPFLCQIIDRDQSEPQIGLRTYMKWEEQIAKRFRNQDIGVSTISGNEGGITWNCEAAIVHVVDDRMWVQHKWFVGGVELNFIAREPRGTT